MSDNGYYYLYVNAKAHKAIKLITQYHAGSLTRHGILKPVVRETITPVMKMLMMEKSSVVTVKCTVFPIRLSTIVLDAMANAPAKENARPHFISTV